MFCLIANPTHFGVLSASPQAHLPGVFHPICILQRDQIKFPLPLCQSCQAHVRPHSTPMLCSSAKMLAAHAHTVLQVYKQGIQQERKVALKEGPAGPSLTHLQCFRRCRSISTQLGSFPFYSYTEWRVHPIASIPQLWTEAWGVTCPRIFQKAKNRAVIPSRTRSCVFTVRHLLHPQHLVKPTEGGPRILCKA